MYRYMLC